MLDVALEREVLSQSLRDPAFVRAALPVLRRHHFSSPTFGWIWTVVETFYRDYREIPTAALWADRLNTDYDDEQARATAVDVLKALRRHAPSAPKGSLDKIRSFVRMATVRKGIVESADSLEGLDLDAAEAAISTALHEAKSTSASLVEPEDMARGAKVRLARYLAEDKRVRFRTPLPTLDRLTNGGPRSGSFTVAMAFLNTGKSTIAVDFGFNALVHSKATVIHIGDEETKEELEARYDGRLTGIDRGKLMSGKLTREEQRHFEWRWEKKGKDLEDRLRIYSLPPGIDVLHVRAIAEQVREERPEDPLLVVVDSPDHFRSSRKYTQPWQELADIYWGLKGLALDATLAPCAVFATTQAGRQTDGKTPKTKDVAGSIEKFRAPDVGLALKEGDGEAASQDEKAIEVMLLRNRLGPVKRYTIYTIANTGTCEFREGPGAAASSSAAA